MGLDREREKETGRGGRRRAVRVGDRWTYLAHLPGNDSLHTPLPLLPPPAVTEPPSLLFSVSPIHIGFRAHLTWPFGQFDCDLKPLFRQMEAWHRAANLLIRWNVKYAMRTAQSTYLLKLHAANHKTNTPSNCACVCVCACLCICQCACVRARTTATCCAELVSWRSTVKERPQIADWIVSWAEDGQRPVVITIFTQFSIRIEREIDKPK